MPQPHQLFLKIYSLMMIILLSCRLLLTSKAAAFDPVVEVVEGEVRDVLHGSDLVTALTSLLITLQRLPDCRARRDEK